MKESLKQFEFESPEESDVTATLKEIKNKYECC